MHNHRRKHFFTYLQISKSGLDGSRKFQQNGLSVMGKGIRETGSTYSSNVLPLTQGTSKIELNVPKKNIIVNKN